MATSLTQIMARHANRAMTGDGIAEIQSLSLLPFEAQFPAPEPAQRLCLVLVEPRLLAAAGQQSLQGALMDKLRRFKTDLRAEGLASHFVSAAMYPGPVQKDGQSVLALRALLRDVKTSFPRLEGVILVGNFPEATLVRTVAWAPGFINPPQLAIWPELVSERADIVLADLNGHWEALYRQADFTRESITAVPDSDTEARGWHDGEALRDCTFSAASYTTGTATFRDAFELDDAIVNVLQRTPTSLQLQLQRAERNAEVDASDRSLVNIIARPDIAVSRINARHIAVNPNPSLVGTDGHRFLDGAGNPQVVNSPTPLYADPEHLNLFNFQDFDLERRLLIDYFERNHRFRIGAFCNLPFRAAAASGTTDFDANYYAGLMGAAAPDFAPPVVAPNASLREYVDFLKTPATLKYVMAHSDAVISQFRDDGNIAGVGAAVGGPPVRWVYQGGQYKPSFDGQGGVADLFVHRALWHNHTLAKAGASLVVHGGCNVNSVVETQTRTYTSPEYGRWSNAEAFLFYTNCVALLSRAKGFNDAPWGFAEGFRLGERANFGNGWLAYFNAQASDAGLGSYNIQRKRAYFWSINGDWSLRLRNRNGLGVVGLAGGSLASVAVHPNRAWIDGWNFDAAVNPIRGIGDLDGDGVDEFVVTSDWGVGVLKHDGISFRAVMQAPRDTWFGGWRWDATVNPGRDQIKAVANFTGSARSEILVWSSWGMSTLGLERDSLVPTRLHANGTRLGGWLFDTATNTFASHGRLVAGNQAQMVLTSPWGLGIVSLETSTALFLAPNGARLGEWLLGTGDNRVRLIADLDGDGLDEILISSPWGVGVLKMVGGTLISVAMHANGDNLGSYVVNNGHDFALADRLSGGQRHEIVVRDDTGLHVLALAGGRLGRLAGAANGSRVDGWLVGTGDNRVQACGDLNGDGRADFLIRSPWGLGVMTLAPGQQLHCHTLLPYGSMLGDWRLDAGDVISGAGHLSSASARRALLLVKP